MIDDRDNFVSALMAGTVAESRLLVREVFRASGWRLYEAAGRKQALACLARFPVHVVIASCQIPDWTWKQVWRDLARRPHPPQLVVTSRAADDSLWCEVLNWGAYDLLREPLRREEVARVISSARRHFAQDAFRMRAAAAS